MGAPMQNERKIFLKLPAEQLSSPGVRELRIWFVFNFTIPLLFLHLTPGQWRRRPRARLLQLEGTCRRITTRLPIRFARHYPDCASRILRETMRAHVWLDYEYTTMILFNGMVFFVVLWPLWPACTWHPYGEVSARLSAVNHSVLRIAKKTFIIWAVTDRLVLTAPARSHGNAIWHLLRKPWVLHYLWWWQ